MKKTYIKPVVVTVAINTSSLICTSPIGLSSVNQDNDVALGRDFDFDDEEELGREYDFDDEEEYFDDEEEY